MMDIKIIAEHQVCNLQGEAIVVGFSGRGGATPVIVYSEGVT